MGSPFRLRDLCSTPKHSVNDHLTPKELKKLPQISGECYQTLAREGIYGLTEEEEESADKEIARMTKFVRDARKLKANPHAKFHKGDFE